jgi:DNA repair protein RecN (Recombination protein N)
MLRSLRIENFALIDQLELSLGRGLTVLTGETGAGKSILLDAIDAVLGGKVGGRSIRTGSERAQLEAGFDLTPPLRDWLTQQEIDCLDDGTLICSRELSQAGTTVRSRSRVNGVVVNRRQLDELRSLLVEITAQGQTVQLGLASQQRAWLDAFGGEPVITQRAQVAIAYEHYQKTVQVLEARQQAESRRLQQLDLYRYQAEELAKAELTEADELERLEQERDRLSHVVELQQQSWQAYQRLYQNESDGQAAADLLGEAEHILLEMESFDAQLAPITALVRDALTQVQEAGRQIHTYGESLESDPERLATVEQRIQLLKQICRKYGPSLAEAIAHYQQISAELEALTDEGQSIEAVEAAVAESRAQLDQACQKLTALRQQTAASLSQQLVAELKPLAMEKVQFEVALLPTEPSALGADQVRFLISPNPGEPLQPLSEIASGGEMSRFLLALKACFSQADPVGTLVFDEIDAGVSGRVSRAIADKLKQLGQQHQVLCVTHQPLVAALADHHFRVGKSVQEGRTLVRVEALISLGDRQRELAELAGGASAGEALAFAEALLKEAQLNTQQINEIPSVGALKARTQKKGGRSPSKRTKS